MSKEFKNYQDFKNYCKTQFCTQKNNQDNQDKDNQNDYLEYLKHVTHVTKNQFNLY